MRINKDGDLIKFSDGIYFSPIKKQEFTDNFPFVKNKE